MTGKRKHVSPSLRQAGIHELVTKRGEVSVELLAAKFGTSSETIRRDLTVLANAGQLRKVHGGARAAAAHGEGGFDARMRRNPLAKHLIAEKTAKLIKPRQTLFLDTGSTTLICAEALAKIKNLTIITNSTRIAATFAAGTGKAEVYLLGGLYRGDNAQTVGAGAINEIGSYQADFAILTAGAVNHGGMMDFSRQEAMVAQAMAAASARVIALADHSKLNKRAAFKACDLEDLNILISDGTPDGALTKSLHAAGVEIL
ncbi:MAG: DeoR family transcriptional regulator [Rhodobacteraceae bacterium]|nr:DeoR family transcriptional regulator [Paracoccaceae bacterium]